MIMNTDTAPIDTDGQGSLSLALSSASMASSESSPITASSTGIDDANDNYRTVDDDGGDGGGGNGDDTVFPTSPPPPTIQEIAEALDAADMDEPQFYSANGQDDEVYAYNSGGDDSYDNNQDQKPAAYSATTVAAISSLMKDEAIMNRGSYDDVSGGGGSTSSPSAAAANSTTKRRELTLQDRASAMISVYKDYIHEGELKNTKYDEYDEEEDGDSEEGEVGKNLHDNRRMEIKNATLQKFCKDVLSEDYDEDDDDDDEEDECISEEEFVDDTTGSNLGRGAYTMMSNGAASSLGEPRKKRRTPPTPRPKLPPPTAATTTAAFRLKAEVALKAVSSKTSNVAKRAAHVVGTAVRDKMSNTANIQEMMMKEVKNDYDFQDYRQESDEKTKKVNNRGRGRVQDERQDDLEYGQIDNGGGENAVYGMHILDRDTSPSFRRKMDAKDEEVFHELCDDLGVTPNTHPQMRYFYEPPPSLRYRYPIFRSKKFKQAMIYFAALLLVLLVSVSIISAVSNGFEEVRKKNAPPLPDWKGVQDWQMKQKLEWETKTELFNKVSAAYRPVWYDRSTGWKGQTYDEALSWCKSYLNYIPCPYEVYCPDENTLLSGVMDKSGLESWAPVINAKNEWVQVGSGGKPCALYSMQYGSHPAWGKNGAKDEVTRNIMCCRSQPLLEGSSWNDPRKGDDEYVVRPKVPPTKYEGDEGEQQQQQQQLQHQQPTESSSSESSLELDVLFFSVSKKYNPVWFDRSSGWKGQTYQEALDFCANFKSYIPCPYDVYCPGGQGKLLDGVKEEGESWAAVIDTANDWVQVGTGGRCNLYSETAKEQPTWGITGQNNEKITRHIMCCDEEPYIASITGSDVVSDSPADGTTSGSDAVSDSPAEVITTSPPYVVMPTLALTDVEIDVSDFYRPIWYDSNSGWVGTTYTDAKAFCESIPREDSNQLHLCPSEAVCPNGPRDTKPLYLQMDAFDDVQWAPISDSENGWIMVGTIRGEEELTCHSYTEIFQQDPAWGLDGSSPAVVKHVLCCEDRTGGGDSLNQGGSVTVLPEVDSSVENTSDVGLSNEQSVSVEGTTPDGGVVVSESSANTPSAVATSVISKFSPMWFTADKGGWDGGSHDDAIAFCQQFAGSHDTHMNLCPYAAYCPQGPTMPVLGGHDADFSEEGEQWAPLYGQSNHWVLIGRKGKNMSTTCLTHVQLNGEKPSWGLDGSHTEMKQHLMCCSSLQ